MIVFGYDVGQATDPPAVVALGEVAHRAVVLAADRMPTGLSYERQVSTVIRSAREVGERSGESAPVIAVDRTGHRDTAERILAEWHHSVAISITSGRRATCQGATWTVPKRLLLHTVARGCERGDVVLGRHRELKAELASITTKPNGSVEAAGSGHDDLALALALAYWTLRVTRDPALPERMEVRGHAVTAV